MAGPSPFTANAFAHGSTRRSTTNRDQAFQTNLTESAPSRVTIDVLTCVLFCTASLPDSLYRQARGHSPWLASAIIAKILKTPFLQPPESPSLFQSMTKYKSKCICIASVPTLGRGTSTFHCRDGHTPTSPCSQPAVAQPMPLRREVLGSIRGIT
jgi:hypothetical protein